MIQLCPCVRHYFTLGFHLLFQAVWQQDCDEPAERSQKGQNREPWRKPFRFEIGREHEQQAYKRDQERSEEGPLDPRDVFCELEREQEHRNPEPQGAAHEPKTCGILQF